MPLVKSISVPSNLSSQERALLLIIDGFVEDAVLEPSDSPSTTVEIPLTLATMLVTESVLDALVRMHKVAGERASFQLNVEKSCWRFTVYAEEMATI